MKRGVCAGKDSYQNNSAAPDIDLSTSVEGVTNNQFWSCVAWAAAAGLHEIALPRAAGLDGVQPPRLDKLAVRQIQLLELRQLVVGIERVGEAKVGDDDVSVPVEQEVLQLEIAVDDALLVQVPNAGNELGKEAAGRVVLEVPVVQDIVKQFSAGGIFEDDAKMFVGCLHLM